MNIFTLPKLPLTEEQTTVLIENKNVRIEQIISQGQVSEWYDQEETEFLVLLDGSAKLEYKSGRIVSLSKGETLIIYPREKHRVIYTSREPPCIWLCVFF